MLLITLYYQKLKRYLTFRKGQQLLKINSISYKNKIAVKWLTLKHIIKLRMEDNALTINSIPTLQNE